MSRTTRIDLEPLLGALADTSDDPTTERILDATLETLFALGLKRCTVEEIAERANLGRSTIYRRFEGRDELIHAVVARELRRLLSTITKSVDHLEGVTDKLVEGFIAGLESVEKSGFLQFVRSEPDLLVFLGDGSTDAISLVTSVMVNQLLASTTSEDVDLVKARHVAELVFRLAVSFVSLPASTFPLDDRDAARAALFALFDPLVEATLCKAPAP